MEVNQGLLGTLAAEVPSCRSEAEADQRQRLRLGHRRSRERANLNGIPEGKYDGTHLRGETHAGQREIEGDRTDEQRVVRRCVQLPASRDRELISIDDPVRLVCERGPIEAGAHCDHPIHQRRAPAERRGTHARRAWA